MIFIVVEINLFFSPWSFVDDSVEIFGREDDDLVVVNHFLEFLNFHRDPPGNQPFDAVAERVTVALYALAELNSIQDPYLVGQYPLLKRRRDIECALYAKDRFLAIQEFG